MNYELSTIKQLYLQKVLEVYDIFKEYFGEDNVDLQGEMLLDKAIQTRVDTVIKDFNLDETDSTAIVNSMQSDYAPALFDILIHWDRVVVRNENDKSILLKDLWAKVTIDINGVIPWEMRGFTLSKSTYTKQQWEHNYVHSHVPGLEPQHLNQEYYEGIFKRPCLGSGPIIATIAELKTASSLAEWLLFCRELELYVHVESLKGRPYKYLENVTIHSNRRITPDTFIPETTYCGSPSYHYLYDNFIEYYLKNGNLKFSYIKHAFVLGMPFFDAVLDISNCFIDYYNNLHPNVSVGSLLSGDVIIKAVVYEGTFYHTGTYNPIGTHPIRDYQNRVLFQFKGENVLLKIEEKDNNTESSQSTILNPRIVCCILTRILQTLNYRYNERANNQEGTSQAPKNVRYI